VVVDRALGPAGGARGVVDGDRLVLVAELAGHRIGRALGQERLVGIPGIPGVVDAHGAPDLGARGQVLELVVGEQEPGAGVLQDETDVLGAEPVVERHQHPAGRRHPVVGFQQRRGVRAEERHPVTLAQPRRAQRRGQPVHALPELPVGVAAALVHHRHLVRVHQHAALEER
jgi:hypothetical protein